MHIHFYKASTSPFLKGTSSFRIESNEFDLFFHTLAWLTGPWLMFLLIATHSDPLVLVNPGNVTMVMNPYFYNVTMVVNPYSPLTGHVTSVGQIMWPLRVTPHEWWPQWGGLGMCWVNCRGCVTPDPETTRSICWSRVQRSMRGACGCNKACGLERSVWESRGHSMDCCRIHLIISSITIHWLLIVHRSQAIESHVCKPHIQFFTQKGRISVITMHTNIYTVVSWRKPEIEQ